MDSDIEQTTLQINCLSVRKKLYVSVSLDRVNMVYYAFVRLLEAFTIIPGTFADFNARSNQLWGMESNALR